MSNQNIDVERQEEIEKWEEVRREANIAWHNSPRKQKLELIKIIVTRNGRLNANGRSVKDASHHELIQEAKELNYVLDQEDQKIWKKYLSTSSKPRKNKGRYTIQKKIREINS